MDKKEEKINVFFNDNKNINVPGHSLEPGSKREVQLINHLINKYKKEDEQYSVLIKE